MSRWTAWRAVVVLAALGLGAACAQTRRLPGDDGVDDPLRDAGSWPGDDDDDMTGDDDDDVPPRDAGVRDEIDRAFASLRRATDAAADAVCRCPTPGTTRDECREETTVLGIGSADFRACAEERVRDKDDPETLLEFVRCVSRTFDDLDLCLAPLECDEGPAVDECGEETATDFELCIFAAPIETFELLSECEGLPAG